MNHFKNEFRKNFNFVFYIIYFVLFVINIGSVVALFKYSKEDMGAIGFAYNGTSQMMSIIIIICLVNIVGIFTNDYRYNTWKNLLCTGTHKNKIQGAKISLSFVISTGLLLLTYVLSFLVGLIFFGFDAKEKYSNSLSSLDFEAGTFSELAIETVFKSFINNIFILIFFIAFIMLVSELFRGSKHVMLITIILYFASNFASTVIGVILIIKPEYKFLEFLPFKHLVSGYTTLLRDEMIKSNGVLLAYSIIFFIGALLLFRKRDIPTSK